MISIRKSLIKHRRFAFLCSFFLIFCCLFTGILTACTKPAFFSGQNDSNRGNTDFNSENNDSNPTESVQSETETFACFCEKLFCAEVASNTINLHFTLAHPETYGITDAPITLGSISREDETTSIAMLENTRAKLQTFDYNTLSKDEQFSYDVLSDYLSSGLSGANFYLYQEFLNPSSGIQSQLPVLLEEYRFYDEEDVKDYLALLPQVKTYFNDIISFEQEKAAAGLFMTDLACDALIAQCADFTGDFENHYLILTFNKKVDALSTLDSSLRDAYKEQNKAAVRDFVFPAYDALSDALSALKGQGKNDKGLCYFKDGKEYYESLVYYNTGSSLPIEDMEAAIIGKRTNDLLETADLLKANENLWSESAQVALTKRDAAATLDLLLEKMKQHFPTPPDTTYTVSYIEECMQDYLAPAFYITAPLDRYTENSIFINATTETDSLRYFTTLAHEGFPGHLYQTVMSYDAGLSPLRCILNYPGYVEGWATYVEMLSYQYAGLPEDTARLMMLNQSALLSLYASTDIGIHYNGWSLADTISFWKDYGIENEASVTEIYQYILGEPANYLKYYVGYLEFLKLKDYAKETYGSYYSDIAFHQAVLTMGPAPFDLLKEYLEYYYIPEDY